MPLGDVVEVEREKLDRYHRELDALGGTTHERGRDVSLSPAQSS